MPDLQASLECKNPKCQHSILLPYSIPRQKLHDLQSWVRSDWQRNFLCRVCKHVCAYTVVDVLWVEPQLLARNERETAVACIQVPCVERDCKARAQINAVLPKNATLEAMTGVWIFDGLRCSDGHLVIYDPGIVFRCPAGVDWL